MDAIVRIAGLILGMAGMRGPLPHHLHFIFIVG
jgi:hypothetical protein